MELSMEAGNGAGLSTKPPAKTEPVSGFDGLGKPKPTGRVAELINREAVGVLVDLDGHFRNSRLELMALRPAPVQALYPFFVGTAAAAFLPYMFTDQVVTPPDFADYYAERLILLPGSYYVNSHRLGSVNPSSASETARLPSRAVEGLPSEGAVIANFNQLYKIDEAAFEDWLYILKRVPGSVLWTRAEDYLSQLALRRHAEQRGVNGSRIVFAGWATSSEDHVRRSSLAQLSVDTPLYNSMTTGCDILWAGVPLVTIPGLKMVSRLGASLVGALGGPWPGLLTSRNRVDFRQIATRLVAATACVAVGHQHQCRGGDLLARAGDWKQRNDGRTNVGRKDQRKTQPPATLFDMERKAQQLETALLLVWDQVWAARSFVPKKRQKPVFEGASKLGVLRDFSNIIVVDKAFK